MTCGRGRGRGAVHELDAARQQVGHGIGLRLVAHGLELDAVVPGEHRGRDEGVGVAGGVVERRRARLGEGHELGDRLRRHRGMDDDEEGVVAEIGDRREIGEDVVGRLLQDVRHDGERAVGAEHEGVAVGGGALDLAGGQRPVGAGLGDDDDGLAQRLLQLLADDAGERVGGRARAKGDDEPDGLRRPGLRLRHSWGNSRTADNANAMILSMEPSLWFFTFCPYAYSSTLTSVPSFILLSPVRGRGRVRGLQSSSPPHLTSPPSGGEEYEGDGV